MSADSANEINSGDNIDITYGNNETDTTENIIMSEESENEINSGDQSVEEMQQIKTRNYRKIRTLCELALRYHIEINTVDLLANASLMDYGTLHRNTI